MSRRTFLVGIDKKSSIKPVVSGQEVSTSQLSAEDSLEELAELVKSRGDEVVGQMLQARYQPDPRTFVGSGKLDEIATLVEELDIEVVVFDDELSPTQIRNLEATLERPILDRTAVILEIFAERAHSREGKIQVELARFRYLLPRLTGKGIALSRLGGGIGTRGPGERQLEFERRYLKARINELEIRIKEIRKHRELIRQKRVKNQVPVVALVGYTNAGKSTLLRRLTGDEAIYVDDRVFATLDPCTRNFRTPRGREVVVVDTVGFIRKLPHQLVAAFRATLEEVLYADVLVHLVDASQPGIEERIEAVEEVLEQIGAGGHQTLLVFNKIDQLDPDELDRLQAEYFYSLFISAVKGTGLTQLEEAIEKVISKDGKTADLIVPHARGDIINYLHQQALVLERKDHPDGIRIKVSCTPDVLTRLKAYVECEYD